MNACELILCVSQYVKYCCQFLLYISRISRTAAAKTEMSLELYIMFSELLVGGLRTQHGFSSPIRHKQRFNKKPRRHLIYAKDESDSDCFGVLHFCHSKRPHMQVYN